MIIYIGIAVILVGLGFYIYHSYNEYNRENAAKALPLATQIPFFLEDYAVSESQIKTRVRRVDVYDDFAIMLTIKQDNRSWDFNIVNKKIATDRNKCIRLHLSFHCKNTAAFFWSLTPRELLGDENEMEEKRPYEVDVFEGKMAATFLAETNDESTFLHFFDERTQGLLLEIYENNKGIWRLQKNTITYKEPIEIDSDVKREQVYKVLNLGFELAQRVDKE